MNGEHDERDYDGIQSPLKKTVDFRYYLIVSDLCQHIDTIGRTDFSFDSAEWFYSALRYSLGTIVKSFLSFSVRPRPKRFS